MKLRRPTDAEINAAVFLAVTFVAGSGAAILGALVDRRLSPRCSAGSGC